MSMHEIEDIIEASIQLVDYSDKSLPEKRNLIWNLFQLQNQFDCKFTHFRMMEILKKNEFVQQFDFQNFPTYNKYSAFFDDLKNKDFEFILDNPKEVWSDENEIVAYWDKESDKIFADFGSAYWNLYLYESPTEMTPLSICLSMVREANKQQNKGLINDWIAFTTFYFQDLFEGTYTTEELKSDFYNEMKVIYKKHDFIDYKPLCAGFSLMSEDTQEWINEQQKELVDFLMN